jgi:hypothetical protein
MPLADLMQYYGKNGGKKGILAEPNYRMLGLAVNKLILVHVLAHGALLQRRRAARSHRMAGWLGWLNFNPFARCVSPALISLAATASHRGARAGC